MIGLVGAKPSASQLASFKDQFQITFPIFHDEGTVNAIEWPLGVVSPYPREVVVDQAGIVRLIKSSYNPEELMAMIEALLAP